MMENEITEDKTSDAASGQNEPVVMYQNRYFEDKTSERLAGVNYLNEKYHPVEIRIVCECDQKIIGSLAEPRMNINKQSGEVFSGSGSGMIGLHYDGNSKLTKTYLVMPRESYIFNFVGKIVDWCETTT